MNESVLQAIKTLEDLRFTKPADEERVSAAERQLGLNFAVDYKDIWRHICKRDRINWAHRDKTPGCCFGDEKRARDESIFPWKYVCD